MSGEKSNFFNRIIMVAGVSLLCTSVAMAERINGSPSAGTTSVVGGGGGYGGYDPCSSAAVMSSGCATSYREVTCRQGDVTCYKHENCATCPTNYKIVATTDMCGNAYNTCTYDSDTVTHDYSTGLIGGGNQVEVTTCVCKCDEEYSWKTIGEGIEKSQTYTCDESTDCKCVYNTKYRCAKGYYGNGSSCTQCPDYAGVHGTTSAAGKTKITDCYIPSSQSLTDNIGTFSFTTQCNAKNAQ